jgi:type IV pilus assembly protein PilM
MMFWRDQSVFPIGVDIGTHAVRMLQLRRKGDRLELIAAARADIAPLDPKAPEVYHNAVIETLRKMCGQHKFIGVECVTALPPQRITCKSLRMPQMPETDVEQAIRWEATDRLGLDLTDGQVVFFKSGEVRRGTEAKDEYLLFAAPPETLTGHIQQIKAAGFKLQAIDLQPCAMVRALHRAIPPTETASAGAVMEFGMHATQCVITQEDRLAFYKNIEIGDQSLNEAVAQKLGVLPAEAAQLRHRLAMRDGTETDSAEAPLEQAVFDATRPLLEELGKELDLCLRYFGVTFRGTRPETLYGIGGQSYCQRSMELIATMVGSRIEIIQPLRNVGNLGQYARADRSTEWAVVTGLSLYPLHSQRREVAA